MTREECEKRLNQLKHGDVVDNLILYVPIKAEAIIFEQGSGSQLISEDYDEGIDSYIMATVINLDPYEDEVGAIVGEGEQYPFFYSTDEVSNEFDIVYDWLESFYNGVVPNITVLRR